MKKLALSSLIAVFAVSGAHAANVIDGNPLYMPKANHFYSVTDLSSHTDNDTPWSAAEAFGYGITDKLAVELSTSLTENKAFDAYSWNDLSLGATFRALDMGAWKADVYGKYAAGSNAMIGRLYRPGSLMYYPNVDDETEWFDKDATDYTWTAGVRGGYVASNWTVAGHVAFSYLNSESFNFGDKGMHMWSAGVDGQYALCDKLNLVAGVEYTGISNDKYAYDDVELGDVENGGVWSGMFGVNYNIDATKYVGLYVNGSMDHWKDNGKKGWDVEEGFGFGAKFGIDF